MQFRAVEDGRSVVVLGAGRLGVGGGRAAVAATGIVGVEMRYVQRLAQFVRLRGVSKCCRTKVSSKSTDLPCAWA